MTHASISESLTKISTGAVKRGRLIALVLVATFASVMPARAQSSDTWKSVAIIGGSTAAGAYIGHKVAGRTGTYVGAAAGAAAGYAIDRHRRQNENYNGDYPYPGSGYYGDNSGYYGNDYPDPANGGYYGDSRNSYPNPSGYQSNSDYVNRSQTLRRR
jgi:hypothetical protein